MHLRIRLLWYSSIIMRGLSAINLEPRSNISYLPFFLKQRSLHPFPGLRKHEAASTSSFPSNIKTFFWFQSSPNSIVNASCFIPSISLNRFTFLSWWITLSIIINFALKIIFPVITQPICNCVLSLQNLWKKRKVIRSNLI